MLPKVEGPAYKAQSATARQSNNVNDKDEARKHREVFDGESGESGQNVEKDASSNDAELGGKTLGNTYMNQREHSGGHSNHQEQRGHSEENDIRAQRDLLRHFDLRDAGSSAIIDPSMPQDVHPDEGVFVAGDPPVEPARRRRQRGWRRTILRSSLSFVGDYYMPLLLIAALVIGIVFSLPGKVLGDVRLGDNGLCLMASSSSPNGRICVWPTISSLCVTVIFFITGLTLNVERLKKAFLAKKEIALGLFQIFALTTSVGFIIAAAPSKLNPPEFSFGLALFCLMPTTMSSCVLIVGYAGGNVALALLLTVVSNVISVAILPFTVAWLIEVFQGGKNDAEIKVNATQLCLSLVFQVIVPLVAAGGLRLVARSFVNRFKDHFYTSLKVTSAVLNAAIPWMRISQNSSNFSRASAASYITVIVCCVALHMLFLGLTFLTSFKLVKLKKIEDIKCVVFIGAQKTLPVALAVLELLPVSVTGDQGLVLVPLIFTYLFQAILDSALAVKWKKHDSKNALSRPSSSMP